ncbi:MAG: acyl-CoA dehydrogenase family protein, partial [Pseudomonadota bacterium]
MNHVNSLTHEDHRMLDEQELIDSAKALSGQFYDRADEIEQARRLPPDVAQLMAEAGFYRMGAPAAVGGLETPPTVSSQVFELLAQGDASAAWVAFIGMTSYTSLAALPAAVGREILADPNTLMTGVFAPTGKADKVDGGFRVSGRWQWGSGSQNAAWVMGGVMLTDGGEPMLDRHDRPRSTMVLMPASELEYLDTWHVSGLCGSGSLDYQAQDLFVPEERVVGYSRHDAVPRTRLHAFPNFTLLALGIGAVCMGIARAAIDELVALAASKKRVGARKTIAEQQLSQITLAQAEADLRSARAFYFETLEAAWRCSENDQKITVEQRRDLRLATTNAVMKSVGVVEDMYNLGGGSAVYQTSRLQRYFRDINVAKTHIMVSNQILETVGALYFGLEP